MQVWSGLITQKLCVQSQKSIKKASHLCFSSKGKLANMSRNNPEHLSPREYRFSKGQCSSCQGNFPGRSELVPPHSLLLSLRGHTLQTSPSVLRANSGCISMQSALQYEVLLSSDSRQDKRETDGFILGTAKDFSCLIRICHCLQKPNWWKMKHFY